MMSFFLWCLIEFWALRSGMEGCAWLGNLKKKKKTHGTTSRCDDIIIHSEKRLSLWLDAVMVDTSRCEGTYWYILASTGTHRNRQSGDPEISREACKQTHRSGMTQMKTKEINVKALALYLKALFIWKSTEVVFCQK